jgi:hypothetical protein
MAACMTGGGLRERRPAYVVPSSLSTLERTQYRSTTDHADRLERQSSMFIRGATDGYLCFQEENLAKLIIVKKKRSKIKN